MSVLLSGLVIVSLLIVFIGIPLCRILYEQIDFENDNK